MTMITIRDFLPAGKIVHELSFEISGPRLTVRDLIAKRIHEEVTRYNAFQPAQFKGLVQPTVTRETANGYRRHEEREIVCEKQAEVAFKAFEQNGFFIFINRRQVDNLEEEIELGENTQVIFVRLFPIIGG